MRVHLVIPGTKRTLCKAPIPNGNDFSYRDGMKLKASNAMTLTNDLESFLRYHKNNRCIECNRIITRLVATNKTN